MNRTELPNRPNFDNTEFSSLPALLGEPISIIGVKGDLVEITAFDILKTYTQDEMLKVQKATRGFYQAFSSTEIGCVPGVEAEVHLMSNPRPTNPGKIWTPYGLELIGPGVNSLGISIYRIGSDTAVDIGGETMTPEGIKVSLSIFFDELGALAAA